MQAIVTKYMGPTDTKGSRIKAKASGGSLYYNIDNRYTIEDNMNTAANLLVKKLNWNMNGCVLATGTLPNGDGVFVLHEVR